MPDWNADLYLKFRDERTRPAAELAARVDVASPETVIDLGCGPGNSTQVLRNRWPEAQVVGLDNSPDMISAATESYPGQQWELADVQDWSATAPYDVVFSNAALMWIGNHRQLIPQLLLQTAPGGAFAFQIPIRNYSPIRKHIDDVADDAAWRNLMQNAKSSLTIESPSFYYDALADKALKLDIWETEYYHIMRNPTDIVEWMSGTGLRPYLQALETGHQRDRFLHLLSDRVAESYPRRTDGRVLFPFRRLFVIAYR